ncbi:MAG: TonB-dependent receptor, partial [Bacteroidales bacterium]|nr:TonB-dependent receptor [Bacteroidales bacterium]
DPCDPVNLPEGTQYRAANCATILNGLGIDPATFSPTTDPQATVSLPGRSGGNPLLDEESAKTWTVGVVLRPSFLPRFSATFDWYDIRLENAISTATAQELVDLCVDQPSLDNQFCENIGRDPSTGYVNDYLIGPANVAEFKTSGADFTINYSQPTANLGTFNFRLVGGYLDNLSFIPTPGAEVDVDTEEPYAPKWVGSLDVTWTLDNFFANYGVNYFSKTRRYTTEQMEANPDLVAPEYVYYREKWEHDIQVGARLMDEKLTVYGGVNNLFDRQPDLGSLNYPSNFRGRYFYAGIRMNLADLPRLF